MARPLGFVLPGLALGAGAITFQPNPRGFFPVDADGNALSPIVAQAVVEELHDDELQITDHPVEVGAVISDHAFRKPRRVTIRCAWSNSPSPPASIVSQALGIAASLFGNPVGLLAAAGSTITAAQSFFTGNAAPNQVKDVYERLLALQSSLIPFTILTGKRQYQNMLFESLRAETNEKSENSLPIVAICREVIIVTTQVTPLSAAVQSDPGATAAPQNQGNQSLQLAPTASPDDDTLSGALIDTQASVATLSSSVNQEKAFLASVQGPLAQLPVALESISTSLSSVTVSMPEALEIPLIPSAQTLSVPLGSTNLGQEFSDSIAELPTALTEANASLEAASKQVSTVVLPESLEGLQQNIVVVQNNIRTSLTRLDRMQFH